MEVPQSDEYYMDLALLRASAAAARGEVPVGAVMVCEGRVVSQGENGRERGRSALSHAEMEAIAAANETLGGWRLHSCTLYVTLEPCPMCMGAIINARIARVVYGAKDPKAGCLGSVCDMVAMPFNHHPQVTAGVRGEACGEILRDFFARLREERKQKME